MTKVKKKRCAYKKENKTNKQKSKKEIPELLGLAAVREEMPNRKRAVEDVVAFLICQSLDMDIICCHVSQSRVISFVLLFHGHSLLILKNFCMFTLKL